MHFWVRNYLNIDPNDTQMGPIWSQNGPTWVQNGPKWVLGALQGANLIMASILRAILAPFWIQQGPQKSSKNHVY